MNNLEFVKILENIAKNYKTLYVMGCIGNNMTEKNKPFASLKQKAASFFEDYPL